jgi:hypothetical protein
LIPEGTYRPPLLLVHVGTFTDTLLCLYLLFRVSKHPVRINSISNEELRRRARQGTIHLSKPCFGSEHCPVRARQPIHYKVAYQDEGSLSSHLKPHFLPYCMTRKAERETPRQTQDHITSSCYMTFTLSLRPESSNLLLSAVFYHFSRNGSDQCDWR